MSEFSKMLLAYTASRPTSCNWKRAVIEFLNDEDANGKSSDVE